MDETGIFGKLICAIGVAALLGLVMHSVFGGVLNNSAASELQIFWVQTIAGASGMIIGGLIGWGNAKLIITGAIFSTITNMILGLFTF